MMNVIRMKCVGPFKSYVVNNLPLMSPKWSWLLGRVI